VELVRTGVLEKDERGRISYVPQKDQGKKNNKLIGRFSMKRREGGMVKVEGSEQVIAIPPKFQHTALHGDTVAVAPFARSSGRKAQTEDVQEGEVVEILVRGNATITGTLDRSGRFAFVIPDDGRIGRDIYLPQEDARKGNDGDKVVVQLLPWNDEHQNPEGILIEVLGPAGDARVEVLSVSRRLDLPSGFPPQVEREAAALSAEIPPDEIQRRLDLRKLVCFTIDPEDAKDFDDAVSYEPIPGGARIGVHIADVSHYVREGTALDREAFERGTSIYMVNEVIPMLPERLSNALCSLRPREDRLTYSVIMDVGTDGTVKHSQIAKSVIHSKRRFTYEEVQRILDEGKGEFYDHLLPLWKVAQTLLKRRRKNGSLDFDTGETKFRFDAGGLPLQIIKKTRLDAHRLIEECMLLANQVVAMQGGAPAKGRETRPFLYRVHDLPDAARLQDLSNFVRQFGFSLDARNGVSSRELQKLLDKVEGSEVENVINEVALRAMAKAVYSMKNIGHYGLAFSNYTHFTSPIRRYPDLVVHRLLEAFAGTTDGQYLLQLRDRLPEIARQSSERERRAMEAERMSVKVMQVEYMKRHLGDEFDGVIVGVTKFGLFVKINDLLVEGLVHIRDLGDDYYLLDERRYALRGRSRGKEYRLGDTTKVRVSGVNPEEHQIQFMLAQ
jgi:ribonuclease R